MPLYCLHLLIEQLPVLRAAEQLGAIEAATAPHLERQSYRHLVRQLHTYALPAPKPEPVQFIEYDPDKAAEWFEARGFRVVRTKKVESA